MLDRVNLSFLVAGKKYSRPVELAQLDKAELDIAGLVLQESLLRGGDARRDLLERGELQFGELNTHDDEWDEEKGKESLRQGFPRLGPRGRVFKEERLLRIHMLRARLFGSARLVDLLSRSPRRLYFTTSMNIF